MLPRLLTLVLIAIVSRASAVETVTPALPFTPEVEAFVKHFKPGGQDFAGEGTTLPPEESRRRMVTPAGYEVELVASEPVVRQPVDLQFDERGRLWVVQYLQYPYPAGLKVTGYDQYLRANYDQVPRPPPHHVRGADRITLLEDRDGDGRFESHRTFLDGLNLATSVLPDIGGVWVLQSPYLLFYPDLDGDDVPDGDPEVHLTGFGLEDTHSLASNLHWGPDGWIYGATGSTTTLEIQGVHLLGQGIWRYHPKTRVFEMFAEGGGNTFSLEFDRYGRTFSGTNSGGTRGLHYVQGATYVKNWPKHGPAMNPFVFGFFEHMGHEGYTQRFPQTFLLYEDGAMPELEGKIVVGMAMTNRVQVSRLLHDTSTFRTVDTEALLTTDDRAFRPVDIESGPDGAIYLADWTDLRLSHLNPADTWDKANGRIFRIGPAGGERTKPRDLRRAATGELLELLSHPNRTLREHSRRSLALRPEPIGATLRARMEANSTDALEAFWVLNLRGELEESDLRRVLRHPNAHLRRWATRLLGDQRFVTAPTLAELTALARRETEVEVRSQLASSARRLPAGQCLAIVRVLLNHDADADDQHLPLLLWWAIESQADTGREEILAMVRDPVVWRSPIFTRHLATRIGRRYTTDQGPRRYSTLKQGVYSDWKIERAPEHFQRNLEMCGRLLEAAPGTIASRLLLDGIAAGFSGGQIETAPRALIAAIDALWPQPDRPLDLVTLAARLGRPGAMAEAVTRLQAGNLPDDDQRALLDLFAATGPGEALPLIIDLVRREQDQDIRGASLTALAGFNGIAAAEAIFAVYPTLSPRLQELAQRLLCEKQPWAIEMLQNMLLGTFDPGALSSANLATLRAQPNPRLTSLLTHYEQTRSADPRLQAAQQLFEAGRTGFNLSCASCHQETGEGRVGLAPALVGSRWLGQGNEHLVRILLHGKENPGRGFVMPPWRQLDDSQLAAILTYVKREFGNLKEPVTPDQVDRVRNETQARTKPWTDEELQTLPPKSG